MPPREIVRPPKNGSSHRRDSNRPFSRALAVQKSKEALSAATSLSLPSVSATFTSGLPRPRVFEHKQIIAPRGVDDQMRECHLLRRGLK